MSFLDTRSATVLSMRPKTFCSGVSKFRQIHGMRRVLVRFSSVRVKKAGADYGDSRQVGALPLHERSLQMNTLVNALLVLVENFMSSIPAFDLSDPKMRKWEADHHHLK